MKKIEVLFILCIFSTIGIAQNDSILSDTMSRRSKHIYSNTINEVNLNHSQFQNHITISDALKGKIPGLQISSSSGSPGSSSKILIRGIYNFWE
jgi:hypothetical protein